MVVAFECLESTIVSDLSPKRNGANGLMKCQYRDPQVNFFVRDVETSVRFYSLFGFEETFRAPASGPVEFVEVRLGGLTLGLGSIEAARRVHGLDVESGPPRAEVCLWTDDVDRAYTDLLRRGLEPLRGPHDFGARLRSAWFVDPDGNPVEIVAEHAGAKSDGKS